MSNQYTKIPYSKEEIDNIIKDYQNGVSLFKLRVIYKRKKENIKSLLMENNIFIEGRDKLKKDFNEEIIEEILNYYQKGMGSEKISKIYGVSKVPILRILKENNVLQKGYSDGKKIILTDEQKHKIKRLYLVENKTSPYISKELNLNLHFIEKYIYIAQILKELKVNLYH
jgi:transposase